MVYITKHAEKRLKERIGLNKKALQRAADTAFEKGIRHNETIGNLNKWVTAKFFQNTNANNIRLYNDKAWIFTDDRLITIIQVPASLKKGLEDAIARRKSRETQPGTANLENTGNGNIPIGQKASDQSDHLIGQKTSD